MSSTIENLTDTLTDAIIYRFRRGEGLRAKSANHLCHVSATPVQLIRGKFSAAESSGGRIAR